MEQELNQEGIPGDEGSLGVSAGEAPVSAEQPKLYTEEDLKASRLGQSKADAALNEALRILEQQKADYAESVKEIEELRKEIERKEDEVYAGDTEGRSAARQKRDAIKALKEVEKIKKEAAQLKEQAGIARKEVTLQRLSAQYGVPVDLLEDTSSPQKAEELAKKLAATIKTGRSKTPSSGFAPDSGVSDVGGGKTFTRAQVASMSYEEYKANSKDIDAAYKAGKIK